MLLVIRGGLLEQVAALTVGSAPGPRTGHDAVVSVERLNDQPTIALTIEDGTHVTGGVITHNTGARQPYQDNLRNNVQFCADEETEILTKRGWMRYDEVVEGEDVDDPERGVGIWRVASCYVDQRFSDRRSDLDLL